MSPPASLAGLRDLLVSTLIAVHIMVAEIVTGIQKGQTKSPAAATHYIKTYQRANDSSQNMHEYGFSPESAWYIRSVQNIQAAGNRRGR